MRQGGHAQRSRDARGAQVIGIRHVWRDQRLWIYGRPQEFNMLHLKMMIVSKFGISFSPRVCTFFRWSIAKTSGVLFCIILRDFPFFLQLMVQKSPVDMVNIPLFIGFHKTSGGAAAPSTVSPTGPEAVAWRSSQRVWGLGTGNSTSATWWCSGVVNRNPSLF